MRWQMPCSRSCRTQGINKKAGSGQADSGACGNIFECVGKGFRDGNFYNRNPFFIAFRMIIEMLDSFNEIC